MSLKLILIHLTLFFVLFNCADCCGQVTQTTTNNAIDKSVGDFLNRPIYKKLTRQLIDTTADDKLLQLVFDNISLKVDITNGIEPESVMKLNKSQQAIYLTWRLQAEVNNGGFHQYYLNSSGAFANLLPGIMKLLDAKKHLKLVEKANAIFEREKSRPLADESPYEKLDEEFYLKIKENLDELQIKYIRAHKADFAEDTISK